MRQRGRLPSLRRAYGRARWKWRAGSPAAPTSSRCLSKSPIGGGTIRRRFGCRSASAQRSCSATKRRSAGTGRPGSSPLARSPWTYWRVTTRRFHSPPSMCRAPVPWSCLSRRTWQPIPHSSRPREPWPCDPPLLPALRLVRTERPEHPAAGPGTPACALLRGPRPGWTADRRRRGPSGGQGWSPTSAPCRRLLPVPTGRTPALAAARRQQPRRPARLRGRLRLAAPDA